MTRSSRGYTLVELIVAVAVFAGVTAGLMSYILTSLRLIARNLSVNHSHDSVRTSDLRMLRDLHLSASAFTLMSFDGTNYTDLSPAATSDVDPLTQKLISGRGNGVRFRQLAGGPYKLTANTTPTSTNLTFDFGVGSTLPYIPQVGDKVTIPVISREFTITAIPTSPTMGSKTGVITISATGGIGYTIDTTTAGNVTTGYFYREIAYSVANGTLRYHPNFTGSNKTSFVIVRDQVTSTQPFALLYPTSTSSIDTTALRISLEAYDSNYTGRRYSNGTATLQAVIPPLITPTPISSTDYTP
jgi:prepilin-type N-terminal cleavage/methylation domain-containing protein